MITTNVKYNTETKLLGMLGYPLGHSVTSIVHNAMYQWGNINAIFIPMEVEDKPGNLDRFFDAIDVFHVLGFSVTMPYKTRLIPYIDACPEECRVFGCVNNVKIEEDAAEPAFLTMAMAWARPLRKLAARSKASRY